MTDDLDGPPAADDAPALVEDLAPGACRRLLAAASVGRLAFVEDGYPTVLPVNFVLAGDVIGIRTAAGAKLDNAPQTRVGFEVDEYDEATRSGWSVLVRGVAHEVTDDAAPAYEELRGQALHPWAGDAKPRWLGITIDQITGRRITRG